jgi:hypothetical protein
VGDRIVVDLVEITNVCSNDIVLDRDLNIKIPPGQSVVVFSSNISVRVRALHHQGILDIKAIPASPSVWRRAKKDRWRLVK